MLSKRNRFHGRGAVRFVMRKGKHLSSDHLRLTYFVYDSKKIPARAAVVVGKKVSKSAPVRNRMRRRIFAHLEPYMKVLPSNVDLIVFVSPGVDVETIDLASELNPLLARIRTS